MADPINPKRKRVVKETTLKSKDANVAKGTETRTVFRRDKVTPKKVVTTDYANYYDKYGNVRGGSSVIEAKDKKKFDKQGNLKKHVKIEPIKKIGGSVKKKYALGGMAGGDDPTAKRKCPKGKCGKVSVAPVDRGSETFGSKLKSGIQKLFTQTHKAGPSRRKRIR